MESALRKEENVFERNIEVVWDGRRDGEFGSK